MPALIEPEIISGVGLAPRQSGIGKQLNLGMRSKSIPQLAKAASVFAA
jgi:hypothetical protein